jgi:two-component system, OmpR family, sensor histidine kinase PhoQ
MLMVHPELMVNSRINIQVRRFTSINSRLLFASALLLPFFLGLTGFFLDRAFDQSLKASERAQLRGHINLLFSVAEPEKNDQQLKRLRMPLTLSEADFEQLDSGLYAYIFNEEKTLIWQSNSANLREPPTYTSVAEQDKPGSMIVTERYLGNKLHFFAHYDVNWEDAKGKPHPFRFVVIHSANDYKAALKAYRNQLWRWLGAAAIFLLIAQTAILQWGLRPLSKLAIALKAMQSGDTSDIQGEHPKELQQLVANLNQVLEREQSLRQRYRNSLADLAHSLKTPLAVLQSKLSQINTNNTSQNENELQDIVSEQVARMNQVVTYQLQRAVSSQQKGTLRRTRIEPVATRILSALQKVYAEKHIQVQQLLASNSIVAGDEQDMMEVLGNLLENAFKYGHRQVRISSRIENTFLCIDIEDDGQGVPDDHTERILERGQRLDTSKPGQGIGLSVAAEIIHSYAGRISVQRSALGGALFSVYLPMVPVL